MKPRLLLLCLLLLHHLGYAQTRDNPLREVIVAKLQKQPKVTLELFVMSQCPFGVMAEESIIPLVKELNTRVDFKLYYIVQPDTKGQLRSLHGADELNEDLRQVLIARHFPKQWLDYLLAHANNYRTNNWKASAQQVGIDAAVVERLMNQPHTLQLLDSHSREVSLRKVYASPGVFIDGEPYTLPLKDTNAHCNSTPPEAASPNKEVQRAKMSIPPDASYNDGPIEIQARVREINVNTTPTDVSVFGIVGQPDDYSFKLWMNDKYDIDATGWLGGQLLTHNFDPPGNTADFNHIFYQHSFATNASPKLLNIKFEAWEDESPDQLLGVGCGGSRGAFDVGFCCGGYLFGLCLGIIDDDDYHCSATPFISDINYRLGSPGQWYDHGVMTGTASSNNFYKPHIETYWRYTKGTSLAEAIDLGTLIRGTNTAPVNTTSTYNNTFANNDGNDVIYRFTNPQRAFCDFSLCSGTTFDTQIYLLDNTGAVIASNDDFCSTQSAINGYDLPAGQYYVVVSGKTSADNGLFALNIITHGNIYVKKTGNDTNDGFTWGTAFQTLQKALSTASANNQIWVAEGTYYPDEGAGKTDNDRNASFIMVEGVKIYGGFPNTGSPTLNDRDWKTHKTILSGDLNQDDQPNFVNYDNNSIHVIFNDNNGLTSAAILDGFTIQGGNANVGTTQGGGMYNSSSSPTVINCVFTENQASNAGGGMYNTASGSTLTNCSFRGNQAGYGGGMSNTSTSNPTLTNCSFTGNNAGINGGGIDNVSSNPTLTNCTIAGNKGGNGGGITNASADLTLNNSIIWGNSSEVVNNSSTLTYNKTLVQGLNAGGFNGTENPLFVSLPDFNAAPTIVGDIRLRPCSPLINQGNNNADLDGTGSGTATIATILQDLDGNPRIYNSGNIDLGAYEYQSALPSAVTPVVSVSHPTTCEGTNGSISLSGFQNNTTYSVTYKKNTDAVASTNFISNGSGVITLTGLGASNYTDIVATYGGCVSNAASAILTDPPKPTLTVGTILPICTGANSFILSYTGSSESPTSYSISGTGINSVIDGTLTAAPSYLTVNLSNAPPPSLSFTLTVKNADNCVSNIITGSVTVNPQPVGPTLNLKTPNVAAICKGTTVSATFNAGSGGVGCSDDYVLIIDGGSPVAYTSGSLVGASANSSIVIQGRRANCSAGSGCNGTNYVTLASWNVNPMPTASLSGTTTVCQNAPFSSVTFTGSAGTAPYTFTYKINNGAQKALLTDTGNSGTVSQSTATAGVFTYTLIQVSDANACSQSQTGSVTLTVIGKPTITLTALGQTLYEGNNPTLCDIDANPVNPLQFTVLSSCVIGSSLWRMQVGNGAWGSWSSQVPITQYSDNQIYRYQAACDAGCPSTYTNPIELTINYRASTPQNVSLVAYGTTVNAGETKTICDIAGNTLAFSAACAAGEMVLYSVDGSDYSTALPSQIVDGNFHNYRVRCRKSDNTPSCVETESAPMSLKITTAGSAPAVSISPLNGCGTPKAFSGSSNCGAQTTIWFDAATQQALPTLPTTTPNTTTSFYARCQNTAGCLSEKSNTVTFTITPVNDPPTISASADMVCTGTQVTISANCPAGASAFWNTGVTESSFQVAFSNVTKQTYWAKCIFPNGCQSPESIHKTILWKAFELTFINIGQSKSAIKPANDRNLWVGQFINRDAGPVLENSTQANPTIFHSESVNKTAPRFWTIQVETCHLGTDGSVTYDLLAAPEAGVPQSFNTHENNAPYFMYANREGFTELYAQNHPAYGFYQDNGSSGNTYDTGLPKGLYKLGIRYWDQKGQGSIYPSTRQPAGNVLAYQEYWFRIQSQNGIGTGATRVSGLEFTVERGRRSALAFAEVAPNPVSKILHLKISEAKGRKVVASLLDAAGRTMLQRAFVPETHQHQEEFEVSQLSNGMYFLQVNTPEKKATIKVVKVQ